MSTPIDDLELPDRIKACLLAGGYKTVEQVQQMDVAALRKVPNLGWRHVAMIREQIPFKAKAPT